MATRILATDTRLAVVTDDPLDANTAYTFEVEHNGDKSTFTRTTGSKPTRIFKATPSGWTQTVGDELKIRFGRERVQTVPVLPRSDYEAEIAKVDGGGAGDPPSRNGAGATSNGDSADLSGVLSFPFPVRSADAVSADGPLEARARRLLQLALGPISDYASANVLKRALARRTEQVEEAGVDVVRWRTGLGGITDVETEVTGDQAGELSLAIQVREIAGEIVESLCPVFPNRDPSEIETTREVLRGLLDEVVEELSRPEISTAVIATLAVSLTNALNAFGEALGYTDENGTINEADVIVGAQETELTRFRILQRWVALEASALDDLASGAGDPEFGIGIYQLEQFLDGAGQAATYVRTVLDQYVDFTALERRNFRIELVDDGGEISLEALLERVENRIAVGLRAQVGVAGRTAVVAGIPSLQVATAAAEQLVEGGADLPRALRNPIVREGVRELRDQLEGALEAAELLVPSAAGAKAAKQP